MPFVVFVCVFDHGKHNDEDQRGRHGGLAVRDRDDINHLHKHDDQEVSVGKFLRELLEQVQKDEVVPGVLGGADDIAAHILALAQLLQSGIVQVDLPLHHFDGTGSRC